MSIHEPSPTGNSVSENLSVRPLFPSFDCRRPFDLGSDDGADLILKSKDGESFYTRKSLLTLASPVFASMFTLPQREGGPFIVNVNGRDIDSLELLESGYELYQLLLWCDPRGSPSTVLKNLESVLASAKKYSMTGVVARIEEMLGTGTQITRNPLTVFALASHYGFSEVARIAARETLHFPVEDRPFSTALENIPAAELHRLQSYYFACGKAVENLFNPTASKKWKQREHVKAWLATPYNLPPHSSPSCTIVPTSSSEFNKNYAWKKKYLDAIMVELAKRPRGRTLEGPLAFATEALEQASECPICRRTAFKDIVRLNEELSLKVEEIIKQVPMNLDSIRVSQ